jgi:hypothetical protein
MDDVESEKSEARTQIDQTLYSAYGVGTGGGGGRRAKKQRK